MDGHLIWFSIFSYCAAFRHRPSIPTTTFFGNCCFTNRGIYGSSQSRIQTLLVNKHIWPSLELVVFHRIHCLNYLLSCLAIYTSALSLTTNYNSAINITQTTARVTALGLNESSFQIWEGALFKSLIVHQNWKEKNKIFRWCLYKTSYFLLIFKMGTCCIVTISEIISLKKCTRVTKHHRTRII